MKYVDKMMIIVSIITLVGTVSEYFLLKKDPSLWGVGMVALTMILAIMIPLTYYFNKEVDKPKPLNTSETLQ